MVNFNKEGYQKAKEWLVSQNKWDAFLNSELTAEQYAMILMANTMMENDMRTKRKTKRVSTP